MLRTFAASLLAIAAMGKGNGDGFLRVNSFETVLVDDANVTMTLFIYNARNGDIDELHGDVQVVTKNDIANYIEFTWCAESQAGQAAPAWDCQRIRHGGSLQPPADPNDAAAVKIYQGTYGLLDGYYSADPADFSTAMTSDTSSNILNDATLNWKHVDAAPDRSNTDCVKGGAANDSTTSVACTIINSHFLRNFATTQTAEDIQLAQADHDKTYNVKGYVKYFDDSGFTTASTTVTPNPAVGDSTVKTIKLVSKAYVDAQNAPVVTPTTNNNNNDSGAMTLGTFAAATAAATCALMF